jgi:NADH dehydrogenase (ubiquinone) 1 beta subcomplex subunit 7
MGGGHDHHGPSPGAMPKAEQDLELLKLHQVPIHLRDKCAHLLVPLNVCRRETLFHPDRCGHQRHIYEECQHIAWSARVQAKTQQRKEEAAAAAAAAEAAASNRD